MEKEGDHSSGVTLSVVPLLQERFRQLQRMKELRQEKELLGMLSESEKYKIPPKTHNYEMISEKLLGSQLINFLPPKPQCQLSLSLLPDSSLIKQHHPDSPGILMEPPSNISTSRFTDAPLVYTLPSKLDQNSGSDVDTSLRL